MKTTKPITIGSLTRAYAQSPMAESDPFVVPTHTFSKIRRRSESYGQTWCTDNAPFLGLAIYSWERKEPVDIQVRCYDQEQKKMKTVCIGEVFDSLEMDPKTGGPVSLPPSKFGQCAVSTNIALSSAIYQLIQACWMLFKKPVGALKHGQYDVGIARKEEVHRNPDFEHVL